MSIETPSSGHSFEKLKMAMVSCTLVHFLHEEAKIPVYRPPVPTVLAQNRLQVEVKSPRDRLKYLREAIVHTGPTSKPRMSKTIE